jgi:hypothetical protein
MKHIYPPPCSLVSLVRRVAMSAVVLWTTSAGAHPGHALTDAPAAHLLTSPYHLLMLSLLGGTFWLAALTVTRRVPRRVLQVCGTTAWVGAAVLWGLR